MKISFEPSERDINIKKIYCPECGEKLRNVGLREDTVIKNMPMRCKRCRHYTNVNVAPETNEK